MIQKLTIVNLDYGGVVTCQFNPAELSISKANHWQPSIQAGTKRSVVKYGGEGLRTVQLSLVFDTYETEAEVPVTTLTDQVLDLMRGDGGQPWLSSRNLQQRPPHLRLQWGPMTWMRVVLSDCNEKYTLFTANGVPVRATLQLKFQEMPEPAPGQNPTSQAYGANRARVVQPGDTIDWIAAQELGDPGAWRAIATANGIADPRRLRHGRHLVIPPEN